MRPRSTILAAAAAGLLAALGVSIWAAPGAAEPQLRSAVAGDGRGGFQAESVGRFADPMYVVGPEGADGLVFVIERKGVIRMIEAGQRVPGSFLDIRTKVSTRPGGMLSAAFAPNYAGNGRFYVFFTDRRGNSKVQEYRRSGDDPHDAIESSARTVIEIKHKANATHNGGQLQFGPDRLLYISTGDGGGSGDPDENAQDKRSLLGKILRIDPRQATGRGYRVPAGNPFVKRRGLAEIFSLGLRNPWRFSFDRATGNLVIADVGQASREEIDYLSPKDARGGNFGWDAFEGSKRFRSPDSSPPPDRHIKPIYEYRHAGGNCAIVGGYVVRDSRIESLFGRYLYADYCKGQLRSLIPRTYGGRDDRPLGISKAEVNSFGEDSEGRIYFASLATGKVFAILPE